MVNNILRKTVKKDFPDSVSLVSISKEVRTNKHGLSICVFTVSWSDVDGKEHYFVFDAFSSAVDFIKSNFQNI